MIIQGDSLIKMKGLEANSIDTIITKKKNNDTWYVPTNRPEHREHGRVGGVIDYGLIEMLAMNNK